jgi:hypothetical protein
MAEGRTTTDTLAHFPTYESTRMTEARRAAYQHDVDSSLDSNQDGHLQIPRKDLKKAVFFKSDGTVDFTISSALVNGVHTLGQLVRADINGDGEVSIEDFLVLINSYGENCLD